MTASTGKIVFIVIDGLGDEEIPELKQKTPLDFADTPRMDEKAKEGKLGLLNPTFYGNAPTSEEGHFSLFGYDPQMYELKRGIVTAESVGMDIRKDDITLRGNFATFQRGEIVDRRAGRIKETAGLIEAVNGIEINGIKFFVEVAFEHRVVVLVRGEGLSSAVTNSDPAYNESGVLEAVRPQKDGEKEKFTADIINKFVEKVHQILEKHPENSGRALPANYLILRGASKKVVLPSFKEKYSKSVACIAGKDLYREIGKMIGMIPLHVQGATGSVDTDVRKKFEKAVAADFDFVFVHIKAADTFAEDGDYQGKTAFLEEIDRQMDVFDDFQGTLVITSDHSTCSLLKRHCQRKIPLLLWGRGRDETERFTEEECGRGCLGTIEQVKMIETIKLFQNKI